MLDMDSQAKPELLQLEDESYDELRSVCHEHDFEQLRAGSRNLHEMEKFFSEHCSVCYLP